MGKKEVEIIPYFCNPLTVTAGEKLRLMIQQDLESPWLQNL